MAAAAEACVLFANDTRSSSRNIFVVTQCAF
jgi:hypothetical protein